jgi:hypothetical protein
MKFLFTSMAIALVLLTGCKKIDELTQFYIEYNEEVVIPASTGISLPFNILTPDIETNSEATFESNNTNKDLIEEIVLTKLDLTLTSPSNEDFSFLESIGIYINADGLDEKRIAWQDDVPDNAGAILTLFTSPDDIKEYIKKDKYTLRVNAVTSEALAQDHSINVYSKFFVDAEVLGQ